MKPTFWKYLIHSLNAGLYDRYQLSSLNSKASKYWLLSNMPNVTSTFPL